MARTQSHPKNTSIRLLLFAAAILFVGPLLGAGELRSAVLNEAVRLYAAGEYPQAIAEAGEVERLLTGMPLADEALLLRSQIVAFLNLMEQVQESVEIADADGILRLVDQADHLDRIIAPKGSGWKSQGKKIRAWGYYLKAAKAERRERYAEADQWYRSCAALDPDRAECIAWLTAKPKLLQKLYLKAQLYQTYDPRQATRFYQDICRMTELTDEMNRKAQRALALTDEPR